MALKVMALNQVSGTIEIVKIDGPVTKRIVFVILRVWTLDSTVFNLKRPKKLLFSDHLFHFCGCSVGETETE